jgi:hypothetical protein
MFVECTYEEACVALIQGKKARQSTWDIGIYVKIIDGSVCAINTDDIIVCQFNLSTSLNPSDAWIMEVEETIMTHSEVEKALGIKYLKIVKVKLTYNYVICINCTNRTIDNFDIYTYIPS